jgi:hypothetical protein
MDLKDFLVYASTAGAGTLAYGLMELVPGLASMDPRSKRRVAMLLSAGVAIAAFGAEVLMGYVAKPASPQAWFELLFGIGAASFGLNQVLHGELKLPAGQPEEPAPAA